MIWTHLLHYASGGVLVITENNVSMVQENSEKSSYVVSRQGLIGQRKILSYASKLHHKVRKGILKVRVCSSRNDFTSDQVKRQVNFIL